jgi:hypothetical protein
MTTIKNKAGQPVPRITCISQYFRQEGETLQDFMAQVKALDEASKEELAVGAARELGYTISEE